jgi:hypothetical protein
MREDGVVQYLLGDHRRSEAHWKHQPGPPCPEGSQGSHLLNVSKYSLNSDKSCLTMLDTFRPSVEGDYNAWETEFGNEW